MNVIKNLAAIAFAMVLMMNVANAQTNVKTSRVDLPSIHDPMMPKVKTSEATSRETVFGEVGIGMPPTIQNLPKLPGSSALLSSSLSSLSSVKPPILMGVFVSDKKRVAIIDSRMAEVGDRVSGFEVKSISKEAVEIAQGELVIRLMTFEKTESVQISKISQMEMIEPTTPALNEAQKAKKAKKQKSKTLKENTQ